MKNTDNTLQNLLDKSFSEFNLVQGSLVKANVVEIGKKWVTLDIGFKSDGLVSIEEFQDHASKLVVEVGDEVEVALEAVEDGYGETRISREKARKIVAWKKLEEALETGEFVTGKVLSRVKGGFSVEVDVIKAFLPGSLVDVRPMKEVPDLENNIEDFKVIKLDYKRNNVVLSRKAVLEQKNSAEKIELLKNLEEGQIVKGIVKNITDYGAFIDLGGLDGLLHITDISWSRVINPKDALNLGEEIEVKVLNFDKEKARVSLGLKQIQNDPWEGIDSRYSMGGIYEATVSNITDYGCFAELEQGVEGLIHLSELDWTNKNIHPSKVVNLDEKIRVMILEMDNEKRRISLGLKQTKPNPWVEFENKYNIGDSVNGQIKSVTDFGVFVGLDGDIDGLIHSSDLSDSSDDETPDLSEYKKGEDISCIIFGIDAERERISLKLSE